MNHKNYTPNNNLSRVGNQTLEYNDYPRPQRFFSNAPAREKKQKIKTQSSAINPYETDSLQIFQRELEEAARLKRDNNQYQMSKKKRQSRVSKPFEEVKSLKKEINDIKFMLNDKSESREVEDKLEKLLLQMEEQKANDRYAPRNSMDFQTVPQSPQYFQQYPPSPYFMQPNYPMHHHHSFQAPSRPTKTKSFLRNSPLNSDSEESESPKPVAPRQKFPISRQAPSKNRVFRREQLRKKVRKIFYAVTFTIFIKHEAKKLSSTRRSNLKKFWNDKFESQMNNIKNWLLDAFKYSMSIVLEKGNLKFGYFNDKSEKIRIQKQNLIIKILHIGIGKLLAEATTQKISLFTEILYHFCFRGSFSFGRFWTADEMQMLSISEFYGFIRADQSMEKFLITNMVFIKVFLYNMILQPHKFDGKNFPRNVEPISSNMRVIGSVLYEMVKEILEQLKNQKRNRNIYRVGNWLQVKKEFIVECSEPLVIGRGYPEEGEYISGLYPLEKIQTIKQLEGWGICQGNLRKIIEKLHKELLAKAKLMRKNLKYKLYY